MYTLEQLEQKTFKELKEIGWQMNVLPAGDRRCRQNWIDAIVGVQPPLLELLEVSRAAEVAPAIEIQRQEPIEIQRQEPIESKFGRIVYPKPAAEPIAQLPETSPGVEDQGKKNAEPNGTDTEQIGTDEIAIGTGIHQQCFNTPEPDGDSGSHETQTLGSQKCDRLLAAAGNSQTVERGLLQHQPTELTEIAIAAAFNDEQPPNRGDGRGRLESEAKLSQSAIVPAIENSLAVTLSARFLALYSPPQSEKISYNADSDGQLSLFDFEVESVDEPPDPDDFDSIDAFWEAMALWDAEHCSPPEVSLSSMCEWAPCPDEWFLPETNETVETVSCTLEISPVSVLSSGRASESSNTFNFSIPTFGSFADRTNRNPDEPPTAGVGARLPRPKPPSFPPMGVIAGDRSSIEKFARRAILLGGRSPPGGDAAHSP